MYIHQTKDWPNFTCDNGKLLTLLANVRHLQGRLLGKMKSSCLTNYWMILKES